MAPGKGRGGDSVQSDGDGSVWETDHQDSLTDWMWDVREGKKPRMTPSFGARETWRDGVAVR